MLLYVDPGGSDVTTVKSPDEPTCCKHASSLAKLPKQNVLKVKNKKMSIIIRPVCTTMVHSLGQSWPGGGSANCNAINEIILFPYTH